MGGICERRYRDSMGSQVLQPGAQTGTHLDDERIAVVRIIVLQPQHPRVDVRHQGPAAEDVGAEAGVCTLRDATIGTDLRESGEQYSELAVKPSPGWMQRRFVSRGKQDRVRATIGWAARSHVQWRVIDLQAARTTLLLLATKADTERGAASFERPTEWCQYADGRPEGTIEQLRLRVRTERERHIGAPFERFDGAVRNLKESSLDEGRGLPAEIYAHAETKAQSQLIGRLGGHV